MHITSQRYKTYIIKEYSASCFKKLHNRYMIILYIIKYLNILRNKFIQLPTYFEFLSICCNTLY